MSACAHECILHVTLPLYGKFQENLCVYGFAFVCLCTGGIVVRPGSSSLSFSWVRSFENVIVTIGQLIHYDTLMYVPCAILVSHVC